MLLSVSEPFDDPDFIFEFKYDGARVLVHITESATTAVSRNGSDLTAAFPELFALYKNVAAPCVLDGELYGLTNGRPDFSVYQKRGTLSAPLKIKRAASDFPIRLAAFDILYLEGHDLTPLPLTKRKALLAQAVKACKTLSTVEYVEECGKKLFGTAVAANLEGIVAKRKSSVYLPGKRSKDWYKIKNAGYRRE